MKESIYDKWRRKRLQPKRYFMLVTLLLIFVLFLVILLHKIVQTYSVTSPLKNITTSGPFRKINTDSNSFILLYPESTIITDGKADQGFEKIILSGNALFYMSSRNNYPLTIYAGNCEIKSNAADFTIHQNSADLKIRVWKGNLDFSVPEINTEQVSIIKGELLSYKFDSSEPNLTYKKVHFSENSLLFDHTPLPEVLLSLVSVHNMKLRIDDTLLPDCLVSGNFQQPDVDTNIQKIKTICTGVNIYVLNNELIVSRNNSTE